MQDISVVSVRAGFATNSSSVHSLIKCDAEWHTWPKEKIVKKYLQHETSSGETEFGWYKNEYSDMCSIINYAIMTVLKKEECNPTTESYEQVNVYGSEMLNRIINHFDSTYNNNHLAYVDHGTEHIYGSGLKNIGKDNPEKLFWEFVKKIGMIRTWNDNVQDRQDVKDFMHGKDR